jgi:hypothetical protein
VADPVFEYEVTSKAGLYVAGVRVQQGDRLQLTARQAAYELELGTVVLVGGTPAPPFIFPRDGVGVALWKDLSASRTLEPGDLGVGLRSTPATAITLTLPNDMPEGFWSAGKQWADGKVSFVEGEGAYLTILDGGTRTRGKGSSWFAQVIRNVDGESAEWDVTGDLEEA